MGSTKTPFRAMRLFLSAITLLPTVLARETVYINGTGIDGVSRELDVSRYPDLHTGDFADCMNGESLFNVTKFDAAYYRDNLTVLFHLSGTTNIRQEALMMHISMDVYGEGRFNRTYNPCEGNITSMCPVNVDVPIQAYAVLPISATDSEGFPSLALGIPDLEGFARLRIFSNSTQTEIGCFQAVLTNGQTLSQPKAIGSILGGFVCAAILASFATAIYGLQIPHMRMHYAHSFSLLVIFETFQSIFFLGALSVDWPSLLPAWWSNFAWTAGMISTDSMLDALAPFSGISGNGSQVGGAGSVPINNGGGLTQQIYGRSIKLRSALGLDDSLHTFARRAGYNASNPYDYNWAGEPRNPGMPIPGDFNGFAGTLSVANVPLKDAFTIGLIWLLVALGAVMVFVALVKFVLDALVKLKLIKTDGFDYFRSHWLGYMASGLLRTLFIAFFAMTTLSTYQFALRAAAGPSAVAAIVFLVFLGLAGISAYACFVRLREGKYEVAPDTLRLEQGKLFKSMPFVAATRQSSVGEEEQAVKPRLYGSIPFFQIKFIDNDPNRPSPNEDLGYIKRFGWLSGRYSRTRWWFFAAYLGYQFGRACFIGGGSQNPLAQVFGLFVFEVFSLVAIIKLKPFEGARNTSMAVWLLSISKIITTGLSIAFLPSFNISRIAATIIGIIILVVQGFLTIAVLVLIVLGTISTWMSLSRNREEFPVGLDGLRIRYFEHMEDRAGMPSSQPKPVPLQTHGSFKVKEVRRHPTLDDMEAFPSLEGSEGDAVTFPKLAVNPRSRANSAGSRYSVASLPRTGRVHRASWSSKDLAEWDADMNRGDTARLSRVRSSSLRVQSMNMQGMRPMTPTRESAEFSRRSTNPSRPEEDGTIAEDKIQEARETPRRRRTVSFADHRQTTWSDSNTSEDSTKVGESSSDQTDDSKPKAEETVQGRVSPKLNSEETIHEKDEEHETKADNSTQEKTEESTTKPEQ
ncbi:hypothetical protein BGZ61DRAFT_485756 [Ilyonectria robusta]|uniref:uncharacterized protein n=1 Tax=Ilyonectria robusta TaxID=1079257 RepID=UPI001E8E6178|nr:uncharacterized protein BGZ61DRAFT_485756 [Ilyonectria robusta]KAH8659559.1 hypothetical protein BGZ61DRAFT_485756 [Ilyonectria robusta]